MFGIALLIVMLRVLSDECHREHEGQVEEELERRDPVLGVVLELELALGIGHAPPLAVGHV
jgi:hypothetical protein